MRKYPYQGILADNFYFCILANSVRLNFDVSMHFDGVFLIYARILMIYIVDV
jgi:hypothetical protein